MREEDSKNLFSHAQYDSNSAFLSDFQLSLETIGDLCHQDPRAFGTFLDYVQHALLSISILPVRLFLIVLTLVVCDIIIKLENIFIKDAKKRHKLALGHLHRTAGFVIGVTGIRVKVVRLDKEEETEKIKASLPGCLCAVANHSSYLDPLICAYLGLQGFAAKDGVKKIYPIGKFVTIFEGLFIQRRARDGRKQAAIEIDGRIRGTIRDQFGGPKNLTIFPEGTTTNGTGLFLFKDSVFRAGQPVQPICIKYSFKKFNPAWETLDIKYHIWRLLTSFYTEVTVTYLPVYVPSEYEQQNPKFYANNVRNEIASVGYYKLLNRTVNEKMILCKWLHVRDHSIEKMLENVEAEHQNTLAEIKALNALKEAAPSK